MNYAEINKIRLVYILCIPSKYNMYTCLLSLYVVLTVIKIFVPSYDLWFLKQYDFFLIMWGIHISRKRLVGIFLLKSPCWNMGHQATHAHTMAGTNIHVSHFKHISHIFSTTHWERGKSFEFPIETLGFFTLNSHSEWLASIRALT